MLIARTRVRVIVTLSLALSLLGWEIITSIIVTRLVTLRVSRCLMVHVCVLAESRIAETNAQKTTHKCVAHYKKQHTIIKPREKKKRRADGGDRSVARTHTHTQNYTRAHSARNTHARTRA